MSNRKSRPYLAHDPDTQLRVIPRVPRQNEIGDVTTVDVRKVPPPRLRKSEAPATPVARSRAPIPSIVSGAVTPAPTNVIPFTKPRAISQLPVEFSAPVPTAATRAKAPSAPPRPMAPPSPIGNAPPIVASSWGSAAVAATTRPALPNPVPQSSLPMPMPYTQQKPYSSAQPQPLPVMPAATPPKPVMPAPAPTPPSNRDFDQEAKTIVAPPPKMEMRKDPTWSTFEKLGLKRPVAGEMHKRVWSLLERFGVKTKQLDRQKMSGHLVTAYRLLGFVILSIIVVVLLGYLITTAFFYMSDSWIVPMAISPTDEKVVTLQSQLSERQTNRDRIAADLDQAERAIQVQQEFQLEFAKAIKSDLEGRKAALKRMYQLSAIASSTRAQIKKSNSAYATAQQRRMAEEWKAGLIDRDAMLNGKFQIAQISGSNLSLAERQAEYETRAQDLDSQTRSLEALLTDESAEGSLSYDVLKIKQEFEQSRLETARAVQNRDMLKAALTREDKLLDSLKKSGYLKAIADEAHVAFVPYANLNNVKKGEPVYGCWLTMVFCGKVGTVLEVLPGEVQFKHPTRDKMLRGQIVEMKLDDSEDVTDEVLFVGGRPLLL
jgi:hypothetical protein